MPTHTDFETAAVLFESAATLIGELASTATSADASRVLQGGSLGREVPQRIDAAINSALACQQEASEAAQVCWERAEVIADYEAELAMYDIANASFQTASRAYSADHAAWFLDGTGTVPHPGDAPSAPSKPADPPSWAEVRRV